MKDNIKLPSSLIKKLVETEFPNYKISRKGDYQINNPFDNDNKRRLYLSHEKSTWFYMKDWIGGSLFVFLKKYFDIFDDLELKRYLIDNYLDVETIDGEVALDVLKEEKTKELFIPEGLHYFSEPKASVIADIAKNYLTDRLIPIEGLGYIYKSKSIYSQRVFIPFYENGKLVYWIARHYGDSPLRYANPKDVNREHIVYNIDKLEYTDTVYIFEGVFDALSLDVGVGTCLLGSRVSQIQVEKIIDFAPKNIIFVPDTDETGQRLLEENVEMFKTYKPSTYQPNFLKFNIPAPYKDFNEYKIATNIGEIPIEKCTEITRSSFLTLPM